MNASTFTERLLLALAAEKMPAASFARALGISKSAVSQYTTGKVKGMHPPNLVRAAQVLRVRVEWLANGTEPMRPEPISPEERALLAQYHNLSPAKQSTVASVIREISSAYPS